MTPMTPPYAYAALSSECADLAQPQRRKAVVWNSGSPATGSGFSRWTDFQKFLEVAGGAFRQNVGLLLVVASQMFFSLMNMAVKKLNSIDPPISTLQLIVVRMTITWICSITYMLSTGVSHPLKGPEDVRLLLVVRGVSGFFSLMGIYFSLQYLSLSDATVLTFLQPLCVAASGALFLKEKLSGRQAFAGLLSLLGVVLIARPPFIFGAGGKETKIVEAESTSEGTTADKRLFSVGMVMALVGVIGGTGALTSLRAIGKRAHPLHSLGLFSVYSVIAGSIGMVVTKTPFIIPTKLECFGMLGIIGIFGFFAQILLAMGLARETASRGSMGIYTQIIFATILEQIFFNYKPPVLSVIGTLIILSCALYVALAKEKSPSSGNEDKGSAALRGEEDIECVETGLLRNYSEHSDDQNESMIKGERPDEIEEAPRAKS